MSIALVVEYLLGFAILFDAAIAWFVLLKNPRKPLNQAYFFMVFWITLWQLTNFVGSYVPFYTPFWYIFIGKLSFFAASLLIISILYFIFVFLQEKHQWKKLIILASIGLIPGILSFTNLIVGYEFQYGGIPSDFVFGKFYFMFVIYMLAGIISCLGFLISQYRKSDNLVLRQKLLIIFYGLSIPIFVASFTHLLLPMLNLLKSEKIYYALNGKIDNLGPASTIIFSSFIAFAILRYRVMDLKVIIRRNAIGLLVTVVFSLIFLLLLKGLLSPNSLPLAEQAIKYFLAFAILFDASIAWIVLLKNPRQAVNQSYFVLVFWITLWQLASFLAFYLEASPLFSLTLYKLAYIPASLLLVSILYFVTIFVDNRHIPRYALFLSAIGLFFAVMSTTKFIVQGIGLLPYNFSFGPLYPYFAGYIVLSIVAIVVTLCVHYFRNKNHPIRIQIQYLFLGFVIPIILGSLTNLFIPLVEYFISSGTHLSSIQSIGPATTTVLSAITAYAIIRHRLMDIKVVIRRSTLAVGAYVIISTALLIPLLILRARYFAFLPQNSVISWVLVIAFLILLFKPLYKFASYLLKKIIKREQYDLHKWRPDQLWALNKIETPEKFARQVAEKVFKKLPLEHFFFVTYDHPALAFSTIFPSDRKEFFDLNEPWAQALTTNPRMLRRDEIAKRAQNPQQQKSLEKMFDHFRAEYCLGLKYQRPELLGAIFIGKRIDGKPFTPANEDFLLDIHRFAGPNQWGILTIYNFNRDSIELNAHLHPKSRRNLEMMK